MDGIERYDVNEEWAHSGIIKAGEFYFLSYCVGNIGQSVEAQINGAIDHMEIGWRLSVLALKTSCRWIASSGIYGIFRLWKRSSGHGSMESIQ